MTWVILKKRYIDHKTGNVYHPRTVKIRAKTLPIEIRNNPEYVEILEEEDEDELILYSSSNSTKDRSKLKLTQIAWW